MTSNSWKPIFRENEKLDFSFDEVVSQYQHIKEMCGDENKYENCDDLDSCDFFSNYIEYQCEIYEQEEYNYYLMSQCQKVRNDETHYVFAPINLKDLQLELRKRYLDGELIDVCKQCNQLHFTIERCDICNQKICNQETCSVFHDCGQCYCVSCDQEIEED